MEPDQDEQFDGQVWEEEDRLREIVRGQLKGVIPKCFIIFLSLIFITVHQDFNNKGDCILGIAPILQAEALK